MNIKKFYFALLALVSLSASAQGLGEKFDTKGHPKARGVWMVVQYPTGWEAKEGARPGVVQRFAGEYAGVPSQLMLQIRDFPQMKSVEPMCKATSEQEWNKMFTDKESGIKATDAKKIKMEGKPGVIVNLTTHMERGEVSLSMATKQMTVCYKDKMINLSCVASAQGNNIPEAKERLNKIEPLCRMYFNSFVLMDNY